MLFDRYQVVVETKRLFRKPIETRYAPMIRCPDCTHAVLVGWGMGEGFQAEEGEPAYDALLRLFGEEHPQIELADAHRNARVSLMTSEARWRLILNAFEHAGYERFVPPHGRFVHVPLVTRTFQVIGVMFLIWVTTTVVMAFVGALLPDSARDAVVLSYLWGSTGFCLAYFIHSIRRGMRSWTDIHVTRRATPAMHRSLARMLSGLEPDGSTLADAKRVAGQNNWPAAIVDAHKVLRIMARSPATGRVAACPVREPVTPETAGSD